MMNTGTSQEGMTLLAGRLVCASNNNLPSAETVVSYLARELSAEEACERLGVGVSRFHEIVSESLQGMVEANERKPAGRPSIQTEEALEVARLEKEVSRLEREVKVARLVEESRWVPSHRKRPKKA